MSIARDTSLTDEYVAAVNRPAEVVHDFRHHYRSGDEDDQQEEGASLVKILLGSDNLNSNEKEHPTPATSTVASASASSSFAEEPIAFVIRNVLTPSECDQLIDDAEYFGVWEGDKCATQCVKRTRDYINTALSEIVEERIRHVLQFALMTGKEDEDLNAITKPSNSANKYMGPVCGIQDNWKILQYDTDCGVALPVHHDRMDCFSKPKNDGSGREDFVVSSHTLLLQLSHDALEGGCTRFYPRGKLRLPKDSDNDTAFRIRQFEHAVDVALPRGWALVFRQRGPMHAEQPLSVSSPCSKYVAQTSILRTLSDGVLQKPADFRNGRGMAKLVSHEETTRIRPWRVRT